MNEEDLQHHNYTKNRAAKTAERVLSSIAVALGGIAVAIYARLDDWKRGRRGTARGASIGSGSP